MGLNDKEKNVFYITHSGELLIWLVVILIVVSVFTFGFMHNKKTRENSYNIFLQDVDGLIVGSPVRMMGIEVGHVTKIKPTNEEVFVKFILTNPDVYIPRGASVTVEFSGMAGSKSLEIYLPDKNTVIDKSTPLLTVNPPKRLHDALGLLNDMFKKIASIISTTSSFGSKLDIDGEGINFDNNDAEEFLRYSNKFLDDSTQKAADFRKSIEGLKENDKQVQ